MRKKTSIAIIVIIVIIVISISLLSISASIGYYFYSKKQRLELHSLCDVLSEQASTGLSTSLWSFDEDQLYLISEAVMKERSVYAIIVNMTDNVHDSWILSRDQKWNVVRVYDNIQSDGYLRITKDITYAQEKIGTVQVLVTSEFVENKLTTIRTVIYFFIGIVSVLQMINLYFMLWLIVLRPLKKLEQYASGVNDTSVDISSVQSISMFGELHSLRSSLFNMVAQLESRYNELRQENRRYSESEKRFRTLVNTIPDLIWLKDTEGRYLSCNKMCERFLGADESSIIGKTASDFVSKELADSFMAHDHIVLEGRKTVNSEVWITFADDGTTALLDEIKTPMYDAEGTVIGVLGIGRDITQRKRAEDEIARQRDSLEETVEKRTHELQTAIAAANEANQAKSIFLSNTSHEIRTPMNAVLGFAQLLERDPSLSPQALNKVHTIMTSGEHLLSIINDILEMSRIESGRVELRPQSVDFYSLLDDLEVMFRLRSEEKSLAFKLEKDSELARYIVVDLGKLRQILINLLGNAVKFTKSGSITLRAKNVGIDRIAVEVADTGIGISPEDQNLLFRAFVRTRSGEQAAGGTGLGLAISREYSHLLGGEITVTSTAGVGSCFRFEFDAPTTAIIPASKETLHRVTGLASGQGEIRILVVDDQSTNRELLRAILEPLGFVVEEASNGEEAIEKTNTLKPSIILMDFVMPKMDGCEATRILRSMYPKKSLVIIGITASAFTNEKKKFLDSGIDAYMSKPFREQELYDLLAHHAGILFETEEKEPIIQKNEMPLVLSLDKMTEQWREDFFGALARKHITRIRKLAEEAHDADPSLSAWLLEKTDAYDMVALNSLGKRKKDLK